MRISEISRRSGIPATTLRFYESIGLLPAERTSAGYRDYDEDALSRLDVISAAKRLGLRLDDIAELLDVWSDGTCTQTRSDLVPRLRARLQDTRLEAADQQRRADALEASLAHLEAMPDCDEPCDAACLLPTECCSLEADERERRVADWRTALDGLPTEPRPDGMRVRVPAERLTHVAALVAAERECCPSVTFDVELEIHGFG